MTPSETVQYLLDGPSVFAELDATGATAAAYLTNPQVIDEIVSFEREAKTWHPLTDALGSVVAISDSVGVLVRTASYDVYGARITAGTAPQLAFGFQGREHDPTGLTYHREFSPERRRAYGCSRVDCEGKPFGRSADASLRAQS